MLCTCISIFIVGNIASGFSRNITELIVFRGMCALLCQLDVLNPS